MRKQKICQKCGAVIGKGINFCPVCGFPADGNVAQNNNETQNNMVVQNVAGKPEKKKDSTLSTISAVLALFTCTAPIGILTAIIDLALSGTKEKKEKHTGSWFAIIFGIIAIVIVYPNFFGKENKTVDVSHTGTENQSDASDKDSQSVENKIYKGQSFEEDGLKVTVTDTDKNFKEYDSEFQKPDKGKKYIKVSFAYENNGDSDKYVSIYDYDCYADGELCEQIFYLGGDFINANISPTRKVSFDTYYVVPKKAESIELEYTSDIWTEEKVIIKIK